MNIWDKLVCVKKWGFAHTTRKEYVLHLLYNRFRFTLLSVGG